MTEDEARTKWCPMGRFSGGGQGQSAVNRDNKDRPITACIASDCMMWRWTQRMANEAEYEQQFSSPMHVTPVKPEYENTEHGFCGLTGPFT